MRRSPNDTALRGGESSTKSRKSESMSPTRRSRKNSPHRKPVFTCFNIFLILTGFQALVLLVLGFLSDRAAFGSLSDLEHFVMSSFSGIDDDDDLLEMEEMLVDHTEKRLEGEIQEEESGPPLDDYYSRQHFSKPVPVIVGGTDGSGTRAFADVLAQLGVPMIIDDPGTLDVHAQLMFRGEGWPPLARMVLKETHSANYELEDLSSDTTRGALAELDDLKSSFGRRYTALMDKAKSRDVKVASKVTYGYKAPVSMLVLPLLQKVNSDGFKFIHVVRDGRDVALSKNKSPIKKFYEDSYADGKDRLLKYQGTEMEPVLGMHLWNDWNTGVLEWERSHADGEKFDYLVMRTEDLLNPEKKFESLRQLADYLGSPRTMEELCCLSRRAVTDMGSSGVRGPRHGRVFEGLRHRRQHVSFSALFEGRKANWQEMNTRGHSPVSDSIGIGAGWGSLDRGRLRGWEDNSDLLSAARQREKLMSAERFNAVGRRVGERLRIRKEAANSAGERRRLGFLPDDRPISRANLSNFRPGRRLPDGDSLFGTSERTGLGLKTGEKAPPVDQRYGKWAKMLEDKPEVVAKLHSDGKKGLAEFGYEPRARFMDQPQKSDFQCDDRVVCGDNETKKNP